ncbi:MAG: Holliday junction resolvase RuvX [Clostridia bacterium]
MKHLSLDLGDARIGIATSDILGIIANGMETYKRCGTDKDIDYIAKLVTDNKVDVVVIGLPINMDGTSGTRVDKSKEFGDLLAQKVSAKIAYQDERLTTVSGERMLIEAGVRRDKRKLVIDKIAATIILQTYLDMH